MEAAACPFDERPDRRILELKRGQVAHSLRYMAIAWGWSVKRVRTFLYRLKMDRQIDTQTGHLQTVITLCNYERYQTPKEAADTQTDTQKGTQGARNGHKEEQLNNKDAAPDGAPVETDEAALFRRGKQILGDKAGGFIASLLKAKKGLCAFGQGSNRASIHKRKSAGIHRRRHSRTCCRAARAE